MVTKPDSALQELRQMHDSLYREKVERARSMSPEERASDVLALSDFQFELMLAGAMHRLGTQDREAGWKEVRRRLDRLQAVQERGLYADARPANRS